MQDIIRKFIQDTSQAMLDAELESLADDLDLFMPQPFLLDDADRAQAIKEYGVAVRKAQAAHDERMQGWQ